MSVNPIAGEILYRGQSRIESERRIQERKGSRLCSMFYILTVVLIFGPRGHSDGLHNTVEVSSTPDAWTIRHEVLMARTTILRELPPTDHRRLREAGNGQGCDASRNGDALTEQIIGNITTTPQEEVLRRIASLPRSRRGKVLYIRRRIAEGTYEESLWLDRTIDRILKAITA